MISFFLFFLNKLLLNDNLQILNYLQHLAKYYFTNRVVPIWNTLSNDVVMADNI